MESLEKQYADVLSPLKENTMPMKFGLKYVQKFAKGNPSLYHVSTEVGTKSFFFCKIVISLVVKGPSEARGT